MYRLLENWKQAKNEFLLLECWFSFSQLGLVKTDYIVRKRVDFKC